MYTYEEEHDIKDVYITMIRCFRYWFEASDSAVETVTSTTSDETES